MVVVGRAGARVRSRAGPVGPAVAAGHAAADRLGRGARQQRQQHGEGSEGDEGREEGGGAHGSGGSPSPSGSLGGGGGHRGRRVAVHRERWREGASVDVGVCLAKDRREGGSGEWEWRWPGVRQAKRQAVVGSSLCDWFGEVESRRQRIARSCVHSECRSFLPLERRFGSHLGRRASGPTTGIARRAERDSNGTERRGDSAAPTDRWDRTSTAIRCAMHPACHPSRCHASGTGFLSVGWLHAGCVIVVVAGRTKSRPARRFLSHPPRLVGSTTVPSRRSTPRLPLLRSRHAHATAAARAAGTSPPPLHRTRAAAMGGVGRRLPERRCHVAAGPGSPRARAAVASLPRRVAHGQARVLWTDTRRRGLESETDGQDRGSVNSAAARRSHPQPRSAICHSHQPHLSHSRPCAVLRVDAERVTGHSAVEPQPQPIEPTELS